MGPPGAKEGRFFARLRLGCPLRMDRPHQTHRDDGEADGFNDFRILAMEALRPPARSPYDSDLVTITNVFVS